METIKQISNNFKNIEESETNSIIREKYYYDNHLLNKKLSLEFPKNEFLSNTKYLLFNIDCDNVIFVPEKEFTEINRDILNILRKNGETSYDENGTILNEFIINSKYDRFVSGIKVFIEGNYKCDTTIDRKWYVKSVICRYDGKYINNINIDLFKKNSIITEIFLFNYFIIK
jgi:hypothetical protein